MRDVDGILYPSVTEIIDTAFPTNWEKKQKQYDLIHGEGAWSQRRQQRAFEGTTLHAAAQDFLQENAFPEINDDIREYWEALSPYLQTLPPYHIIALEKTIAHRPLFFAGTPDAVIELETGERWLLEFKTFDGYPIGNRGYQGVWPLWKRKMKGVNCPSLPTWEWTTPIFRRALLQTWLYKLVLDINSPKSQVQKISILVATHSQGLQEITFPFHLWQDCHTEALAIVKNFNNRQT